VNFCFQETFYVSEDVRKLRFQTLKNHVVSGLERSFASFCPSYNGGSWYVGNIPF